MSGVDTSANGWHIRLFGKLELQSPSGGITPLRSTKAGALLGYLALHPNQAHTREVLAELLWPEADLTSKRTRLRQELLALRSILGEEHPSPLRITTHTIELHLEDLATDVERFLHSLDFAAGCGDLGEKEWFLTEAVTLYRGDLLSGYPELAVVERHQFATRFHGALRELAALREQRGDPAGAAECLHQFIAFNPLQEEAYADLMRLYAAMRQPAMIRRQYQVLEQVMRAELNAEPSESTRRLMQDLLVPAAVKTADPAALPSQSKALDVVAVPSEPAPPRAEDLPTTAPPSKVSATQEGATASRPLQSRRRLAFLMAGLLLIAIVAVVSGLRRTVHRRSSASVVPPLQRGQENWTYLYSLRAGEKGDSEAKAVVSNKDGNIYVTGLVQTEHEDTDILTLKLSPQGKLFWADRYSSPEHDCDRAFSMVGDTAFTMTGGTAGCLYVAGETYVPEGSHDHTGWYIVVIKYDSEGHRLWVRRAPTVAHSDAHCVKVVINLAGGVDVGGTTTQNGITKMLLLRYDANGALLWQRSFQTAPERRNNLSDLATDSQGNVYACGTETRVADQHGSHDDWLTVCYDVQGRLRWARTCEGSAPGANSAQHIASNVKEEVVYVSGLFYTGDPAHGGHGINVGVVKYGMDGRPLWTRCEPDTGPEVSGVVMATSGAGSVTVAATTVSSSYESSIVLKQYDSYGSLRWRRQLGRLTGSHNVAVQQVGIFGRAGETAVCGTLSDMHPDRMYLDSDVLSAAYSADGRLLWQNAYRYATGTNRPNAATATFDQVHLVTVGQVTLPNGSHALAVLYY